VSSVSVLVSNDNSRSMLGLDYSSGCHNRDVGDLMVVNTL